MLEISLNTQDSQGVRRKMLLPKQKASQGLYYDLIRVPHGHIPAPKANLWSHFPIPVKELRDWNFYSCPECGDPSFFKINYMCRTCEEMFEYDLGQNAWDAAQRRAGRRARRKYFKELLKRIEYLILPFLVLMRKAWYVRSVKHHIYNDRRIDTL